MKAVWKTGLAGILAGWLGTSAVAANINASNPGAIRAALSKAKPGDVILIKPGVYDLGGRVSINTSGTERKPITLRCVGDKGYAVLKTGRFSVSGAYWNFIGIHFQGDPATTDAVLKVSGEQGAHNLVFTDCKISGSKGYGLKGSRTRDQWGDHVVFEHCEVFDTGRTAMDVVGGDHWIVRRCHVYDYGKAGGIAYGIFLKGGGKHGVIEGNLVDGKGRKTTVGISFGGGLTGEKWLPLKGGKVAPEHENGIARNNIVVHTSDVAYHSNNAADCKFYNNLAYKCSRLQCQRNYPPAPLAVNCAIGKLIGGGKGSHNVGSGRKEWFRNPDAYDFRLTDAGVAALSGKGKQLDDNPEDMFGAKRDPNTPVIGPVLPDAQAPSAWTDRR